MLFWNRYFWDNIVFQGYCTLFVCHGFCLAQRLIFEPSTQNDKVKRCEGKCKLMMSQKHVLQRGLVIKKPSASKKPSSHLGSTAYPLWFGGLYGSSLLTILVQEIYSNSHRNYTGYIKLTTLPQESALPASDLNGFCSSCVKSLQNTFDTEKNISSQTALYDGTLLCRWIFSAKMPQKKPASGAGKNMGVSPMVFTWSWFFHVLITCFT